MPLIHMTEPADLRLRYVVIRELGWDPQVNPRSIDVSATGGTITLAGAIDSYVAKLAAERAAKRVRGVHTVVNNIVVQPDRRRPDSEIAHDAATVLATTTWLPPLHVAADRGHLTITGNVEWLGQRELAEHVAAQVHGVVAVHNGIAVKPRSSCVDMRRRILRALRQLAVVDARRIDVSVQDSAVTLTGTAGSWAERDAAENAASQTEGVTRVNNRMTVTSELADGEVS